ncbi:MAG: outer membrane protein transport protein, partial [Deltaproteobacteria bacterium]|nr:outer membrane protein transport protein [Deltaproteobacteria bacterium]MBW2533843.1 outer membrane protein transport protein [Deltaproteobacteria bacterium]
AAAGAAGILGGALPAAEGSVPDSYGFGSRATAMAGANTADAADFSAAYYNPAGLVEAPGVEVSAGYTYWSQQLTIDDRDNQVAPVHGLVGGVVAPGELFGIPFAFGVATHLPDNGVSFIYARRQEVPRWELYDTRAQLLYLSANLAIGLFDVIEIGGGIAYLSATRASFGIRGRADILSPYESQLQHEVDGDLTAVRFPQLGARVRIPDWGAIGVTYRGQSQLDLELDAHLEGIVEFAGIDVPLLYELEAKTIASFTPHQLAVGLSFQRVEGLHVNFDLTWLNWSAYVSPTAKLAALLEVQPPPGTPVELPDEPAPTVIVPPEFEDRFVPRFGVEYRIGLAGELRSVHGHEEPRPLLELPVRAGYVYEQSPVPDQTGPTNYVDADRHTVSAGLGVTLNAPAEELGGSLYLDVHGALSVLPERTTLKASPADFVGDYRAEGTMYGIGSTLGVVF